MTDQEIRIAVAEAVGFRDIKSRTRYNGIQDYDALCGEQDGIVQELPNYLEDLNAMHEAEAFLSEHHEFSFGWKNKYAQLLQDELGTKGCIFATAKQRAVTVLKTLNKWKD